jgi:hypothetical protein
MDVNEAFEAWLDRDNPYGPYEVSVSQFKTDQHLCVEDAVSNLRWAFVAGFKAGGL